MTDELFRPTIHERPLPHRPPWRPESILYPAFFGGPLAAATLGVLNGRKLGLRPGPLVVIAVAGVVAFATRVLTVALLETNSSGRIAGAACGVLAWFVVLAFQRRPFRAFVYGGGDPDSLIAPGLTAAILGAVIEGFIIVAVAR